MGEQTVRGEDLPGFATSRISALIGNEAVRMLQEGVASAWDTRLDILEYLAGTLGERFRPTNLHRRMVAAGRLGRKSGRGVHEYGE